MIIELDSTLADKLGDITMCQFVFLTLVLNENQSNHQDVHSLLSRVSEPEVQELIDKGWVTVTKTDTSITYNLSDYVLALTTKPKDYFDEFYDLYPVYVYRSDGTKGFLRANVNKCRFQYNKIIGKSKAMHEHIMRCLNYELSEKMRTNNMLYMKTMWKWITNHEWEAFEEQMQQQQTSKTSTTKKVKIDGFA